MPDQKKFDVTQHVLVPSHKILSELEVQQVLEKFNISTLQMPAILATDSVVKSLGAKKGNVIEIERKTQSGKTKYYRVVV